MADFVVGVGPKLVEAFRKYLGFCKKNQDVFEFTPGVFDEFFGVQQVPDERKQCSVLVFGRGDAEDFKLKGFDIAARAVATLSDTILVFVGAPHGKHGEIVKRFIDSGIPANRLKVRGYMDSREDLKRLFCEVDLVLMPSRTEGFGLTGLEALSAGLPVLVSKNSGFGEALGSVPCSLFVIADEDPSAWRAAIESSWNKDRKSRLDEVKAVRGFYAERYSWSKQCKHLIEKMVKLVDGPSSELEITARAVEARKRKLNEDFTARASCPNRIIEGIRQVYQKCEGVILPIPWCDKLSFQIDDIFTRLKIVEKEKTRGITTTREVTNMTGIFTPHKGSKQPLTVLIEGEPGIGKTTYCQKLVFDWASKQCHEWDDTFPRIDVLLFLRCRGIKSTIWEAIEDQILPDEIEPEEKEMFFQFLKENPSKVLLVLDGLDEADPQKLEMYLKLVQKKQLPGCYIVLTSREEAESKVRPYTDTLLEIVGFTIGDAEGFIRKYFQDAKHLAERLISKVHNFDFVFDEDEDEDKDEDEDENEDKDEEEEDEDEDDNENKDEHENEDEDEEEEDKDEDEDEDEDEEEEEEDKDENEEEDKDEDEDEHTDLWELLKNPLNTLLLCVIFEDLEGTLPTNRTQLYVEIVLFILRRYESKNGLSNRGKDLLLVYKRELMILGESALDSLCKQELHFDDLKGDIKKSLLMKFGFLSIQSGGSKRAPCDRYGFFHKSFQEFFSGYFLAFAAIDNVTNSHSVLTDERYVKELSHVLKFMSGIVAQRSKETAVSIVESIASIVNETGLISPNVDFLFRVANILIEECKTCSRDLYTEVVRTLGERLQWVDVEVRSSSLSREFTETFFQALAFNSTISSLKLTEWTLTNFLPQAFRENTSLSSLNLALKSIRDKGANLLAQALGVNTSLSSLNLYSNSIHAKGANSLAQALRVNTSLSSLDLSGNSIGYEGQNSLNQALRVNTSLSSFDFLECVTYGDTVVQKRVPMFH
ncbi:PREDICTED: uncharacterized protein LOC107338581 [Acropora digitifera]|uniref:uncharacterized protein LOC107338581 n=1 Tax=Acropora digitifera TaxID=70779 RepID=UPI00077A50E0|nr:PREDICTED: uncharacterized protein LOC107338581 [Acropora digitifera]